MLLNFKDRSWDRGIQKFAFQQFPASELCPKSQVREILRTFMPHLKLSTDEKKLDLDWTGHALYIQANILHALDICQ